MKTHIIDEDEQLKKGTLRYGYEFKPLGLGGSIPLVAPLYSSGEIGDVDASTVAITFDQNITAGNYATGVTIKVNSVAATISSATRQTNHAVVYYVLSAPAAAGDTVTWEYTGGNIAAEDDGAALGTVTAQTVTNNITEEDAMLTVTTDLTNDQIKALPTTAIQVVAAPGANKVIFPIAAWLHLLNWAGDYGNIGDTGRLGIEYSGTFSSSLLTLREEIAGEVTNLLVDGASHPAFLGLRSKINTNVAEPSLFSTPSGIGQFVDDPGTINTSLRIYAVNSGSATGNYNGGHANNTLRVVVCYIVIDLA